jgi:Flp pilus assembly protein TadG
MDRKIQPGRHRRAGHRERGAVSIVVALSLAVLIGFVGLALDLGKLYVTKSELQNSADACALAAARDLTSGTPSLSVSEAAGLAAGNLNKALFQSVTTHNVVTYSDSLSGTFVIRSSVVSPSSIKYVQCTVPQSNIANWFIQVLNVVPGVTIPATASVSARAVASLGSAQTTCALPVFICTPASSTPALSSYPLGTWLTSKVDASGNNTYGGGNFGWADLTNGNGASSIASQLDGSGQCNLPVTGTSIGTTGNKPSLANDWNTRFGIYGGGASGVTDFTGYAYTPKTWSAQANAYADFLKNRASYATYQGDATTGLKTQGKTANQSVYKAGSDRRLVVAPMVDCSGFLTSGSHTAPVVSWACVLMLDPMQQGGNVDTVSLEYVGDSKTGPCVTEGMPGSATGTGPAVPMLVQ